MAEDILEKIKNYLLENKVVTAVLGTMLVMSLAFVGWSSLTSPKVEAKSDLAVASTNFSVAQSKSETKAVDTTSQTESTKIVVDIKGAVKNEGVYELSAGSRVTDVVKLAGGFTDEADKKSVNLAEKLSDEAVIYVAKEGEEVPSVTNTTQANSGAETEASTDKINLNTATLEQLQTISGIGAKRAQDIIDYREANGGFSSVDDLTNVSGIGEKTLEKLKSEVTVD